MRFYVAILSRCIEFLLWFVALIGIGVALFAYGEGWTWQSYRAPKICCSRLTHGVGAEFHYFGRMNALEAVFSCHGQGGLRRMVRIKVEYDKYTRMFKLVDREFGSVLEDRAHYELLLPFKLEGVSEEENLISVNTIPLAHA